VIRQLATALARVVATLFVASVVVFLLIHASGDPVKLLVPWTATPERVAEIRAGLGLDQPLYVQYGKFVAHAVRGDFGDSLVFRRGAMDMVLSRLPATLTLVAIAFALALLLGIPLGVYAAARRGGIFDRSARAFAAVGQGVPSFVMGILLILIFSVALRVLPTSGKGGISHAILPGVTLAIYLLVALLRLTRSSMIDVLGTEYIKLARLKGLRQRQILWKHGFRNGAMPVVTFTGLMVVGLINAAVVVEAVFAWPGVGGLIVSSVMAKDFPVVMAGVMLLTLMYAISAFVVDLLYGWLDPRIRRAG
jgi:peptide/nickel transport system permease protein